LEDDDNDDRVGDIIDIVKTKNINQTNEYMVLTKYGLYFVDIKETKKQGNPNP
jgi:hypothetical protein